MLCKVNFYSLWWHLLSQLFVAKPRRSFGYACVLRRDLTQNLLPIIQKNLLYRALVLCKINFYSLWRHLLSQLFVAKPRRSFGYGCVLRRDLTQNLVPIIQKNLLYKALVRQERNNCIFRQSYFSSDQGGKTGIMPKHNEDFSNAEQEEKNKYKCASISFLTH